MRKRNLSTHVMSVIPEVRPLSGTDRVKALFPTRTRGSINELLSRLSLWDASIQYALCLISISRGHANYLMHRRRHRYAAR